MSNLTASLSVAAHHLCDLAKYGLEGVAHLKADAAADHAALLAANRAFDAATSTSDIAKAAAAQLVAGHNAESTQRHAQFAESLLAASIDAACGALLQLAKQALSQRHGNPKSWPAGRQVGSLSLTQIILQARNQSQHYEEGRYRNDVESAFNVLRSEHGPQFDLTVTPRRSHARDVIQLLGWLDPKAVVADLDPLLS